MNKKTVITVGLALLILAAVAGTIAGFVFVINNNDWGSLEQFIFLAAFSIGLVAVLTTAYFLSKTVSRRTIIETKTEAETSVSPPDENPSPSVSSE